VLNERLKLAGPSQAFGPCRASGPVKRKRGTGEADFVVHHEPEGSLAF
jgi:hypothetical protein